MGLQPTLAFAVLSKTATEINAEHVYSTQKDARYAAQNLRDYFHEEFIIVPVTIQEIGSFY